MKEASVMRSRINTFSRWLAIISFAFALPLLAQEAVKVDAETFSGLDARNLGPAAMSGRVASLDAVHDKGRLTIYVGSAGGGLWKSRNGGTTFKPVFDKYNQSIGAVTIDPNNHEVVWVGTGESWMRNSVSVGDGVYKTTNGGDDWQRLGLEKTEHIARILVDPRSSDTVYVCATGHLWDANPDRGVFKTTDGGKSWKKVLFVNDDTGCAGLAMDPQDTGILYAGMWQFRRKPYSFNSGGPGSGLYKSTDGGATWTKLTKGLPEGDLGRIAVAVAPSRPNVVYAVVEAKKTGLYRSDDLGQSWTLVNATSVIAERPFYFALLAVDPKDYNRVYKPSTGFAISEDGGKTFNRIGGSVHSDFHAVWIDPENPERMIVGDDGGVSISEDRGTTFRFVSNLPLSQFYHVSYDMEQPYNVYGGLQDNNSWYAPSNAPSGIHNRDWRALFGGDGFWAFNDPTDPDYVYAEYQGGHLARVNKKTMETRLIAPAPGAGERKFRFNWNTPLHISSNQKGTIYLGAQYLFRSRDHGNSWERISPDLTTDDPEKQKQDQSGGLTVDNSDAEAYTTIYAISESPKNGDLIWVGTDDGNLQVTRDGGKAWTKVSPNVPGLPPNTWVSSVEASHFDEGTAYVSFDGHANGDMKTYVFKTADYGKTWQALATPDVSGYAHVIREDLVNRDLLFLGTEFGLFISIDGGKDWAQFKGGQFPPVAVRDLAIHPRDRDLILATHGRGIWILDDISPLRALNAKVLASDVAFLETRPSAQVIPAGEGLWGNDEQFIGRPRTEAAVITYYLKKRHIFGDLKLEIYDSAGKLISTVPGGKRRGINRVEWAMREKPPKVPPAAGMVPNMFAFFGPRVMDGAYTVKLIKGDANYTTQLKVVPDPRSQHTRQDRELQYATTTKLYDMLGRMTYIADAVVDARDQARDRVGKLAAADPLRKRVQALADALEGLRGRLVATREGGGITGEEKIREKLGDLYGNVNGYEGRPTQSQIDRADAMGKELDMVFADFTALTKQFDALNGDLEKKKLTPMKALTQEDWKKKQRGD
jgi:photosystem II stability/assembly factor-like uncharacterized protein